MGSHPIRAAWEAGDVDAVVACFAPDGAFHSPVIGDPGFVGTSASREGRFARLGVVPDHVVLDAGRGMGEATRLLAVLGERHVATDCDELVGIAVRPAEERLADPVTGGVVTKEHSDGRPGVQQRRVEESRFQDAICVVTAR